MLFSTSLEVEETYYTFVTYKKVKLLFALCQSHTLFFFVFLLKNYCSGDTRLCTDSSFIEKTVHVSFLSLNKTGFVVWTLDFTPVYKGNSILARCSTTFHLLQITLLYITVPRFSAINLCRILISLQLWSFKKMIRAYSPKCWPV